MINLRSTNNMEERTYYRSALTDTQWQVIKKFIPKQIWRRRILKVTWYLVRIGCLPESFPNDRLPADAFDP